VILVVSVLGIELFRLELAQPDDPARDLAGGTVASMPISMTWTRGQGIDHESESPYED